MVAVLKMPSIQLLFDDFSFLLNLML